jgi:uncharacterized protein YwgA
VERAGKPLSTRDTVLLIALAVGEDVRGRTLMQKLAYFSGLELGVALGHRPHYYGPYSAKIEDALSNAVIAGELHETVERMPDWSGGPDLLRYTYTLQDRGKQRAQSAAVEHPAEWTRIRTAVCHIKEVLPSLDQKTLSAAAKTYLIIDESDGGVDEQEIPGLAQRLGWSLTPAEVSQTIEILNRLGLLEDEANAAEAPRPGS